MLLRLNTIKMGTNNFVSHISVELNVSHFQHIVVNCFDHIKDIFIVCQTEFRKWNTKLKLTLIHRPIHPRYSTTIYE